MIRYYIVEGETEKAFLTFLKEDCLIPAGKIRIFNLMQKNLSPAQDFLSIRSAELICIIDTDIAREDNLKRLTDNIRKMKKSIPLKHIKLLAQNKNFEDELCRLLSCKTADLPQKIKCKGNGADQLKRKLINMNVQGYERLLKDAPMHTYCQTRPEEIRIRLEADHLDAVIATGEDIILRRKR